MKHLTFPDLFSFIYTMIYSPYANDSQDEVTFLHILFNYFTGAAEPETPLNKYLPRNDDDCKRIFRGNARTNIKNANYPIAPSKAKQIKRNSNSVTFERWIKSLHIIDEDPLRIKLREYNELEVRNRALQNILFEAIIICLDKCIGVNELNEKDVVTNSKAPIFSVTESNSTSTTENQYSNITLTNNNEKHKSSFVGNMHECVINTMERSQYEGNHCLSIESLYQKCCDTYGFMNRVEFDKEINYQIECDRIVLYRGYCYFKKEWEYESFVAESLSIRLKRNKYRRKQTPIAPFWLIQEVEVLDKARQHRIVMITGVPKKNTITILKAMLYSLEKEREYKICFPTKEAAQTFRTKTKLFAECIQQALNIRPGKDYLDLSTDYRTSLYFVLDAELLTWGMFAGLLKRASENACQIILLGSPLSNMDSQILSELEAAGVPRYHLKEYAEPLMPQKNEVRRSNLTKQIAEIQLNGKVVTDKID